MATGLRNALGAGVALVMALAIVASAGPARADNPSCSPQDVWNDFSNAWASAPTCAAACGTGVGCFAAVAIAEGLAAAKAGGGSGASQFCGDVQSAQNTLSNAGAIVSDLGQVGVPQSLLQTVTDALGAVADPLAAAQCACDETNAIASLADAVGSCIEAGVCAGVQAFGGACGCTQPPTTTQISCPPILETCSNWAYQSQVDQCIANPNDNDPVCQCYNASLGTGYASPPIVQINTPGGTEVIQGDLSCGNSWACFCPSPMTVQSTCDAVRDINCSFTVYYCACPGGTHPDSSGKLVCLCDTNNQPANFTNYGHSFEPMCPPCATGQVQVNGNCVGACAQSQVRTPDGSCCDPNQVTYCGQCCPAGMTPHRRGTQCGFFSTTAPRKQDAGAPRRWRWLWSACSPLGQMRSSSMSDQ
jgi:hypothetical protein